MLDDDVILVHKFPSVGTAAGTLKHRRGNTSGWKKESQRDQTERISQCVHALPRGSDLRSVQDDEHHLRQMQKNRLLLFQPHSKAKMMREQHLVSIGLCLSSQTLGEFMLTIQRRSSKHQHLKWTHDTDTPRRSEASGIEERCSENRRNSNSDGSSGLAR